VVSVLGLNGHCGSTTSGIVRLALVAEDVIEYTTNPLPCDAGSTGNGGNNDSSWTYPLLAFSNIKYGEFLHPLLAKEEGEPGMKLYVLGILGMPVVSEVNEKMNCVARSSSVSNCTTFCSMSFGFVIKDCENKDSQRVGKEAGISL
jgi:hypothetical protein